MRNISRSKTKRLLFFCLIGITIGFALMAVTFAWKSPARADELRGDQEMTREKWFKEFFESKPPAGALHLFRFADEVYVITKPISWVPGPDQVNKYKRVDVPVGFVTDLASVPRIFWQFLPRDGKYTYPAIVHDYLYWMQHQPRESADDILRIGMEEFNIDNVVINAVYWGVKAGGRFAWSNNASLKSKGEKRVLKRLPADPLIRWEDWKKQPDVFQ
jgi:hypothetical protein